MSMSIEMEKMVTGSSSTNGTFECKTCGKRFQSFQALGGHQGIHRKVDHVNERTLLTLNILAPKAALHRCKICMKEFETGPALGGHMTRHRLQKDLDKEVVEGGGLMLIAAEAQLEAEERHYMELMLAAKEWRLFM
ncbi:putative transcription factor C2H2 family [Helianthus annuus]|uniref:Putative zinc finger C2H2-type/integrase DNA-binding domain-containing protein n=1 Tax=Helianthus annuus TaxID=4232 RepID=A0A251RMH4_HELAN|nr:zinc finger protein ZAT11 [Helianthus annuus]KAF5754251.1 putative transcription factor C2H2 family [Helianthus annuus]KAJ0428198.1 putative transcription factor C2H2 family [Helianthus annuus]KAJ0432216.1 putative transcription factor C2H2 family [Helianthus annuus]KAJ0446511.1 putative transcription factor C2H2 family [Helianthus annuus]KAJ0631431.1 putative transcription factor C2H2 family [Helianthus annuus]